MEQKEATQRHTGRHFKSMLLGLLLFLYQKPQLHKEREFPWSRFTNLPAKYAVWFHRPKGHIGTSLFQVMGIVLGSVVNVQLQ